MSKVQSWILDTLTTDTDECIIWPFARNVKGYGNLRINKRYVSAHRFICEIMHGDPPTIDHVAAHSCGKGFDGCVNHKHLSWKTYSENEYDKVAHGTARYYAQYGPRSGNKLIPLHQIGEGSDD